MGQAMTRRVPSLPRVGIREHERRAGQCRGKAAYKSRSDAKAAKRRLKKVYGRDYSAYLCPYCQMWHLTTNRIGARKWAR